MTAVHRSTSPLTESWVPTGPGPFEKVSTAVGPGISSVECSPIGSTAAPASRVHVAHSTVSCTTATSEVGTNTNTATSLHHLISPAISVATQTTVDFNGASTPAPETLPPHMGVLSATTPVLPVGVVHPKTSEPHGQVMSLEQQMCYDHDQFPCEAFLESVVMTIKSLSEAGDAYWLSKGRKKMGMSTATDAMRAALYNFRDNGIFCRPVAIATVLFLKRLAAVDAKFFSHFTVLRYTVAACVVANKMCGDTYFPLQCYSDYCQLSRGTIASTEVMLLTRLDYDVQLHSTVHEHHYEEVARQLDELQLALHMDTAEEKLPLDDIQA